MQFKIELKFCIVLKKNIVFVGVQIRKEILNDEENYEKYVF